MSDLLTKLKYTLEAVDDIYKALKEKGSDVTSEDELAIYGNKIRALQIGEGSNGKFFTIEYSNSAVASDNMVLTDDEIINDIGNNLLNFAMVNILPIPNIEIDNSEGSLLPNDRINNIITKDLIFNENSLIEYTKLPELRYYQTLEKKMDFIFNTVNIISEPSIEIDNSESSNIAHDYVNNIITKDLIFNENSLIEYTKLPELRYYQTLEKKMDFIFNTVSIVQDIDIEVDNSESI